MHLADLALITRSIFLSLSLFLCSQCQSVSPPQNSDKGGCDRRPEGQAVSVERVALHVGAVEANLSLDMHLQRGGG